MLSRKEDTLVSWYFILVKVIMIKQKTYITVMTNKERVSKGIIFRGLIKTTYEDMIV